MEIKEQMTPEEKIAQIEASMSALDDKKKELKEQMKQLEKQKEKLRAKRDQFIAQIILEKSVLSEIDDDDFLSGLSSITVESPSKLLNNADIIKLRYYLNSAIILWRHGNDLDRYRLLDDISALAYKHLYDADDFIDIFSHKIEGKSVADIINMSKQIIDDARQKQENHGQLTK